MAQTQPFDIARLYKTVEDASRNISNMEKQRQLKTSEFIGKETEIAQDKVREIEAKIQSILGQAQSGGGAYQAMGLASMFMNPLAGGILSGLSSFLGGSSQKRKAERALNKASKELSKMPSKYKKSWLGKSIKDWTSGYETQFKTMKQNLPSDSDIFKSSLISGLGTYLMGGGKSKMNELRGVNAKDATGYSIDPEYGDMSLNVNPGAGIFSGGLDLFSGGQGTSLFGEGSLLSKFFSGDKDAFSKMTNTEKMQLGKILQLLKLDTEGI